MKIIKRLSVLIAFTVFAGTANSQELKTTLDSAAYAMGAQFGESYFLNQIELNIDAFYAGLKDGYNAKSLKVREPEKSRVTQAFNEYIQQKQQEKSDRDARFNTEVSKSILAQNRQNEKIKETASGLQYEVIKEGKGKTPVVTDRVKVHYVGTLYNGQTFDSSRERGEPATFGLNQVIKGWTEGLQLMTEGSTYKFWIPAELGYGNRATGSIPAGSLLIFEVELIEVNPQ